MAERSIESKPANANIGKSKGETNWDNTSSKDKNLLKQIFDEVGRPSVGSRPVWQRITAGLVTGIPVLIGGMESAYAVPQVTQANVTPGELLGKMDTSPSSSEIIWDGLSDQETKEINKWLSLSKEEQINIYSEITEFWSSNEALPMPVFDPEVVRGMLAYYENADLKKYRKEMTMAGCEDPDWNLYTANLLRAYDESEDMTGLGSAVVNFKNGISREEIIRIGLEQDTSEMILNSQEKPGILKVNCEGEAKKIGDAFMEGITFYEENGAENIVDVLNYNGNFSFYPVESDGVNFMGTFDNLGTIYWMYIKTKLNDTPSKVLFRGLRTLFYTESVGISYERLCNALGINENGFLTEAMKGYLGSETFEDLYNETKNKEYSDIAIFYLADAKSAAKDHFKTLDDPKFLESVKFMKYYGIVKPLVGDSWD